MIGAPTSSNCNRLCDVAIALNKKAYLINGPEELDPEWLDQVDNIGITSGASTPESLVEAVIRTIDPDEVIPVIGADEDVNFVLPREMR